MKACRASQQTLEGKHTQKKSNFNSVLLIKSALHVISNTFIPKHNKSNGTSDKCLKLYLLHI